MIKGVPIPKVSEPFRPISNGYISGFSVQAYGSASTNIFIQNVHLLSGANASVENYIEQTGGLYPKVLREELTRVAKVNHDTIKQKDSGMTGFFALAESTGLARSKFDIVAAKQLEVEAQRLQALRVLEDYPLE